MTKFIYFLHRLCIRNFHLKKGKFKWFKLIRKNVYFLSMIELSLFSWRFLAYFSLLLDKKDLFAQVLVEWVLLIRLGLGNILNILLIISSSVLGFLFVNEPCFVKMLRVGNALQLLSFCWFTYDNQDRYTFPLFYLYWLSNKPNTFKFHQYLRI